MVDQLERLGVYSLDMAKITPCFSHLEGRLVESAYCIAQLLNQKFCDSNSEKASHDQYFKADWLQSTLKY